MGNTREIIAAIFVKVLSPSVEINDETSSKDIRSWDSFKHVILINALEEKFNIKFDIFEMLEMQTFGEIYSGVVKKLQG